ncbi:MAG: membrane integrity-associated transporter subunit PqiC [Nitrospinae bacterium]|nr:membrane integrity-associated transporter subunit PqiC [Nitrospinota bacterium]
MIIFKKYTHVAALFCLLLFVSGCVSTTNASTKFYILNPISDAPSLQKKVKTKAVSVVIDSLRLPQYLERPQIVMRTSANELSFAEFHQWGGNLRKNMMRTLAENLSQLLGSPEISMAPNMSSVPSDFRLELEILRFEKESNHHVSLSAQWRILKGKDNTHITSRLTKLKSKSPVNEKDFAKIVEVMSELFGELSSNIAQAIIEFNK